MRKYFKYSLLVSFLCILFISTACSDEEVTNSSTSKYLPIKIVSEGKVSTIVTNYRYDKFNRLSEIIKRENFQGSLSFNEIYLKIIYREFEEIEQMVKVTKSYTKGKEESFVVDTLRYFCDGLIIAVNEKDNITLLETNPEGQVIYYRYREEPEEGTFFTRNYHYDESGNISLLETKDESGIIVERYIYSHDSSNSIFQDVNIPQWFLVTQLQETLNIANNCIQGEKEDLNGRNIISTIKYEYNNENYPINEIIYREGYSLTVDIKPTKIYYLKIE